ncbi:MAG: thiamine-phosphate kinase [Planctomycetota bacterium]
MHRWLLRSLAGGRGALAGSWGHDAAVLRPSGGREVACTDQTIEGVHFARGTSAAAVGRKAVARALSDIAATAARPRAVLVALHAPRATDERWIRDALRAARDTARAAGAELVGGDLAAAPGPRSLAVTALGVLEGRRRPPGRDRARPGQIVLLSGPVGGSSLGRHLAIVPRLALGRFLHRAGATALMDVSDGLALDLARLAERSGVRIDLEAIPVHPDARRLARRTGRLAQDHALSDGEDHELLATLAAAAVPRLLAAACRRFPGLAVVGRVRRGRGLWLRAAESGALAPWSGTGGWIHGT